MVTPGSKWSTRYGAQYRRLCARPGCSSPAVATLRFQSTERLAWLVELDDNSARTQGDLCSRHAAALVLPRGWELHDERTVRPAVGEPEAAEPIRAAAAGSARRARARRKTGTTPAAERAALPGFEPEGAVSSAAPTAAPTPAVERVDAPAPEVKVDAPAPAVEREVEVEVEVEVETEADAGNTVVADDEPAEVTPSGTARGVPAQFGASEDSEVVDDALDEILDARTPLLRRAFRNAKPNDSAT